MDLEQFLTHTVDEYLFADLDSMRRLVPSGASGACVYPMLASAFAGVELLGALASPDPFDPEAGRAYFRQYWRSRLYPTRPRMQYADLLYHLVRSGIVHGFATKGPVHVFKDDQDRHFVERSGRQPPGWEIHFGATQFVEDFKASYPVAKADILGSPDAAKRFKEMQSAEAQAMEHCFAEIRNAPLPQAPATQPLSQPSGTHPMYAHALKKK